MNKTEMLTAATAVMIICLTVVFLLFRKKSVQKDIPALDTVFSVTTITVKKKDFSVYIKTNGNVEPLNTVSVHPQVSGMLSGVFVSLGDSVAKGTLVAEVNPSKPGETYRANRLYSPAAGTVASLPLITGADVTADSIVAVINADGAVRITTAVPERYIGDIARGEKAAVRFCALSDETFSASVSSFSPAVDSRSRTAQTVLKFDRNDSRIRAGMFAELKICIRVYKNAVAVPQNAVLSPDENPCVFTVVNGSAVNVPVQTAETVDGMTRITGGLSEGDTVVVSGNMMLSDGAAVKEMPAGDAQ